MDIRYVLTCCTDMALGDSRKYPWPYMYTDGFSEFWGQGGVLWTGNPRALHWGLLTTGIPKAWGVLNLEFPQGKDESVFLENAYFIDLMTNWQTLLMAAEDKHPLISDVFIWYSFVEENQQKVGFTSSSRKTCCKTSFFLSWKQPHKLFCPFDAKHCLLTEDAISSFKPQRLKFKIAEIKIYILLNYLLSVQTFITRYSNVLYHIGANVKLGPVQTLAFSWGEPNSNEGQPKLIRMAEVIQTPILIAAELNLKGGKCSFRSNCLQKML